MKTIISGFTGLGKPKGNLLEAVDVYQSSCWYCKGMWFDSAKVESNGYRCKYCGELNYYNEDFKP